MPVDLQRAWFLSGSLQFGEGHAAPREKENAVRNAGHARGNKLQSEPAMFPDRPDQGCFNILLPHVFLPSFVPVPRLSAWGCPSAEPFEIKGF